MGEVLVPGIFHNVPWEHCGMGVLLEEGHNTKPRLFSFYETSVLHLVESIKVTRFAQETAQHEVLVKYISDTLSWFNSNSYYGFSRY